MAEFGENFRGGRESVLCPLCDFHLDSQEEAFYNCSYIQTLIEHNVNYFQLFSDNIPKKLIETIKAIENSRK